MALVVLGSSLRWENVDVWESEIAKLKVIPHYKIIDRLKTSFNSLQDDHDKDLFLHIACFFVGRDKDYAITILEGCGFYAGIGIQNLVNRYLLTVDQDNKLRLHNLFQEMGRKIVSQESFEPEGCSIVWHHRDPLRLFSLVNAYLLLIKQCTRYKYFTEQKTTYTTQSLGFIKRNCKDYASQLCQSIILPPSRKDSPIFFQDIINYHISH